MSVVVHGWWLKLQGAIVVEVFVLAIENHQMGLLRVERYEHRKNAQTQIDSSII
jgi:hypothetical protein